MNDDLNPNANNKNDSNVVHIPSSKVGRPLRKYKSQRLQENNVEARMPPGADLGISPPNVRDIKASPLTDMSQPSSLYPPSVRDGQQISFKEEQQSFDKPPTLGMEQAAAFEAIPQPSSGAWTDQPVFGQSAHVPLGSGNQADSQKNLVSNAVNMMRRWSNHMAAVTGHTVQPLAPPMERHPQPLASKSASNSHPREERQRKLSGAKLVHLRMRHRRVRGRKGPQRGLVIALAVVLAIFVLTSFGTTAYGYGYYTQQQPNVDAYANKRINQNTRIYDRNGVLLYDAYDNQSSPYSGRRVTVSYDQIPKVMQDAMISIEDKTFWTNEGVDPLAIIRASTSSYGGGSTLTQQVIKNLTHDTDHTYARKLAEAAMALGLTQKYPKSKILEMYFNLAPFGAQTYGVEVAAEDYFGLKADCSVPDKKCVPAISLLDYNTTTKKKDPILGLARATFLAAQPNSPSLTDPTFNPNNKKNALARQKLVLDAMMKQSMTLDGKPITAKMAQEAEDVMAKQSFKSYVRIQRAPNFVDYVIQQVVASMGGDYLAFETAGLNIRTTIDVNLVDYIQSSINRHIYQPEVQKVTGIYATLSQDNNVHNAAVVVEDSKTGEILAMNGSANFNSTDPEVDGQFNAAVGARPPGSTFKPFDYATAFEMGWNPAIVLYDNQTFYPNGAQAGTSTLGDNDTLTANGLYVPSDYGATYHNAAYSVRDATAGSLNIPAIKAMQFAGGDAVLGTVQRLGITTQSNTGLAWAIGATSVSPLQMVGAYQTFADSGLHLQQQTVLDIWDNAGNSFYHYNTAKPIGGRVFSPQVSYLMTSVLVDEPDRAFEFANDHDLSFADIDAACATTIVCSHQVAAKTGTTDGFRDNWTIGYTDDITVGVWVGNTDNSEMTNVIGITGAAPIWHSVIERTLGYCNDNRQGNEWVYDDGVPCGPNYNFRFSSNPQWTFPVPSGVSQSPLSSGNGLPGSGAMDWVINDINNG
jgi:membrane peptidoglycan carboxypeptidase